MISRASSDDPGVLDTRGGQKAGFAAALVAALLAAADPRSVFAPRERANNHAHASYLKEYLKGADLSQ